VVATAPEEVDRKDYAVLLPLPIQQNSRKKYIYKRFLNSDMLWFPLISRNFIVQIKSRCHLTIALDRTQESKQYIDGCVIYQQIYYHIGAYCRKVAGSSN